MRHHLPPPIPAAVQALVVLGRRRGDRGGHGHGDCRRGLAAQHQLSERPRLHQGHRPRAVEPWHPFPRPASPGLPGSPLPSPPSVSQRGSHGEKACRHRLPPSSSRLVAAIRPTPGHAWLGMEPTFSSKKSVRSCGPSCRRPREMEDQFFRTSLHPQEGKSRRQAMLKKYRAARAQRNPGACSIPSSGVAISISGRCGGNLDFSLRWR